MCGITGIINYNKELIDEKNKIMCMTKTLYHRGPDAINYYINQNVLLGHSRLVVVDPKGGLQPMTVQRGERAYTIIYNGELYNTEDLRAELKNLGHWFESYSDTEVLLHAYMAWGEECLGKLNGIFAFAVWDHRKQSLFLARDRVGVKPLFYGNKDGYFVFASEIKSILASKIIEPIISEKGLLQLFSLGPSRPLGESIFDDIYEVKPGEYMVITKEKQIKKIYWDVETKEHTENTSTTIEHIRYLVEDSIQRQLVSDVPLCTFLSGGLDSSIISAVASQQYKDEDQTLHTYCIDYKDNDIFFQGSSYQPTNDTDYAKMVSQSIGSTHHNVLLGVDELTNMLWDATYANDYPGMADIDSSLLLFCKEVKNKFTVALSGECADEIFGGYPWYNKKEDRQSKYFPWIKHTNIRKDILNPALSHLKLDDYGRAAYDSTISKIDYIGHEDDLNQSIRRLTYLNYKWFMVTLLTRKDRMSMYNSLEVRVPYADHRILEYAYNIPWSIKYLNSMEKGLLREAVKDYLPKDIVYRKKSPYPKTYNPEYINQLKVILLKILNNSNAQINNLINKAHLMSLLNNETTLEHPWFGQLMKFPQFIAYLIQLHYFLEMNNVIIKGV